jgi:hypothetical protein
MKKPHYYLCLIIAVLATILFLLASSHKTTANTARYFIVSQSTLSNIFGDWEEFSCIFIRAGYGDISAENYCGNTDKEILRKIKEKKWKIYKLAKRGSLIYELYAMPTYFFALGKKKSISICADILRVEHLDRQVIDFYLVDQDNIMPRMLSSGLAVPDVVAKQ